MNRADPQRPAWIEIDPLAIASNVAWLRRRSRPAELWAVVKGNGYGHGAVTAATAALAGGASALAVALVSEGEELRAAGLDAPIVVLSEPPPAAMVRCSIARLEPTVYSRVGIEAAAAAGPLRVHLKIDTGMHRVGAAPSEALSLARQIRDNPALTLRTVWTHLALAEESDHDANKRQLKAFDAAIGLFSADGIEVQSHVANSAATINALSSDRGAVRCGIAIYGLAPSAGLVRRCDELQPALRLVSQVSFTKRLKAGEAISYGATYRLVRDSTIATVPIGYADGVPRRLYECAAQILIGGRRYPIAGAVTMDQLMVDCGSDEVRVGDEVVLIGRQGEEEVTAWEWATKAGTIAYEIVCGLSDRLPRLRAS